MKKCVTLLLAAVLAVGSAFSSQAGSAFKKEVPLTLHMDINNRQTPIYDGYTSYIMGNRASEKDTFTVTKNSDTLNLDDVTLSYYLVTYNGGTEKNLECRVYGLKEGEHYPVSARKHSAAKAKKEMFTTPWNAATWWNFPRMMSAKNIILPWLRKQIWLLTVISIWENGKKM